MYWWMIFYAVICLILLSRCPIISELFLRFSELQPMKVHVHSVFFLVTMVLFTTPAAVYLFVWSGLGGWGQPILIHVCLIGTIRLDVINKPASSALAANDMTNFMIPLMASTAPLNWGIGTCSKRKIWSLDLLCGLVTFR